MRVGIDSRILGYPRSGIAGYTLNILKQFLIYKDLEIVLFSDRPIYGEYIEITKNFETVIFGQEHRKRWSQFYLPGELKKRRIDIYHATWNNAVSVFTKVPSVLTVHDIIPLVVEGYFKNWRKRLKYVFLMRSALSAAKAVVTISEKTKSDLIKHFNVASDKIEKIYYGIEPYIINVENQRSAKDILNKFKISKDYIINIGSFDKRRNADTLIKAFGCFIRNTRVDCQLVLVGGYDRFTDSLNGLICLADDLRIKDKIIFTNYVSHQEKYILVANAKMMAHVSLYEGFCFPIFEAMSVGVPVVASNTGSIPEVAGEAVLLIDPTNEILISKGMESLWKDEKLRREIVGNGWQRIKKFSWEKTAKETKEIYEKIY